MLLLEHYNVILKDYRPISLEDQEKALIEEDESKIIERAPTVIPIYYYHPDHLGTSTALTDFNGNAYQFFLNLPFGETMSQQLGSNYYNSPFKFNGKELDEETGFYYYGARYYDPKISIWLSVDPLAEKYPNFNSYNYVMQNPLNLIDPTGMEPEPDEGVDPPTKKPTFKNVVNVEDVLKGKKWVDYDNVHDCNKSARAQNRESGKSNVEPDGAGYQVNMYIDEGRQSQSSNVTPDVNLQKGVDTILKSTLSPTSLESNKLLLYRDWETDRKSVV